MILITGSSGVVGKILTNNSKFLKKKSWLGYDIKEDINNDIRDFNETLHYLKKHRIKSVLHLAALTDLSQSLVRNQEYMVTNYIGTIRLVTAMRQAGVKKIIYASTASLNFSDNPYSKSKSLAEEYLLNQKDLDVTIVRLESVIKTNGSVYEVDRGSLLDNLLRTRDGFLKRMKVFGNYRRNFMLPSDVVDVFEKALKGNNGEIIEITNPISIRVLDLVEMFRKEVAEVKVSKVKPRDFEAEVVGVDHRLEELAEALKKIKEMEVKY